MWHFNAFRLYLQIDFVSSGLGAVTGFVYPGFHPGL